MAYLFLFLAAVLVCAFLFGRSVTIAILVGIFQLIGAFFEILVPFVPWILAGIVGFTVVVYLIAKYTENKEVMKSQAVQNETLLPKGNEKKLDLEDSRARNQQSDRRKPKTVTHQETSNKTRQRSGKKTSSLVCPNCNYQSKEDELFCSECGTKLVPIHRKANCQSCGAKLKPNVAFCSQCGAKIDGAKKNKKN